MNEFLPDSLRKDNVIAIAASAGRVARAAAFAFSLAVVPAGARAADPPADIEHGRALARTWCAQCHSVERDETRQRADGLPSFIALANNPRQTPERLRAFLTRPHGRMPDLTLSRQDREDLIGYMLSMKEGRATPSVPGPAQRRP